MRYGVALPNGGPELHALAELAEVAEGSGWDGVFIEDYIVYQGQWDTPTYDPWVLLAAMAARTRHVRLGTMVTPLARRRPWKVAREAVTIDHLSGGRLIVGAGGGDPKDPTFERFGEETDARRRARMLDEALEVLAGAWSGEPFTYDGQYFRVRDVTLLPRPVQRPRIPIWIGGQWPLRGPVKRMVRWDGCCPYKSGPGEPWEDMIAEDVRAIRTAAGERHGNRPFEISVGGRRRQRDWEAERAHIRSVADAGATWWTEYVPPGDIAAMRASIERGPLRAE